MNPTTGSRAVISHSEQPQTEPAGVYWAESVW
jgi:hypothetical protein